MTHASPEEPSEMIFIAEDSHRVLATVHPSCLGCWAFLTAGSYLVGHGIEIGAGEADS